LWLRERQAVSEPSRRPKRTYSGLGGGHWIAEKIERGKQIRLEDGSLWKISVRHRLRTMLWETSQQITVAENDDLLYPYRLINQNTGDVVEAELVSD